MKRYVLLTALMLCAAPAHALPESSPEAQESTSAALLAYTDFFPEPLSPGDAGMTAQEGDARLLKAVVLSRHGLRSPVQKPSTLEEWSARPWPRWDEAPGCLTERGAELVRGEWGILRQNFARDGLFPATGCPDSTSVFIYADGSQRSRATAEAMLQGLAPGCGFSVTVSRTPDDPILHPVQHGSMPAPLIPERERHELAGELAALHHAFETELDELGAVLGPSPSPLCPNGRPCALADIPTSLIFPHTDTRENVHLRGGMAIAASTAEILLLQCLQWPTLAQSVPMMEHAASPADRQNAVESMARAIIDAPVPDSPEGTTPPPAPAMKPAPLSNKSSIMVNPQTALRLLPVHSSVLDAVQRAPETARANGLPLLLLMAEILEGDSPLSTADDAALAVFSGHDTNIANIAALLGLHWDGGAFPADSIPPGAMLVFRLWQTPQGQIVQASFVCQTLDALLSTDERAMGQAALHEEPLPLPGAAMQTPSGPGLELKAFSKLARSLAGNGAGFRTDGLFEPAPAVPGAAQPR